MTSFKIKKKYKLFTKGYEYFYVIKENKLYGLPVKEIKIDSKINELVIINKYLIEYNFDINTMVCLYYLKEQLKDTIHSQFQAIFKFYYFFAYFKEEQYDNFPIEKKLIACLYGIHLSNQLYYESIRYFKKEELNIDFNIIPLNVKKDLDLIINVFKNKDNSELSNLFYNIESFQSYIDKTLIKFNPNCKFIKLIKEYEH